MTIVSRKREDSHRDVGNFLLVHVVEEVQKAGRLGLLGCDPCCLLPSLAFICRRRSMACKPCLVRIKLTELIDGKTGGVGRLRPEDRVQRVASSEPDFVRRLGSRRESLRASLYADYLPGLPPVGEPMFPADAQVSVAGTGSSPRGSLDGGRPEIPERRQPPSPLAGLVDTVLCFLAKQLAARLRSLSVAIRGSPVVRQAG